MHPVEVDLITGKQRKSVGRATIIDLKARRHLGYEDHLEFCVAFDNKDGQRQELDLRPLANQILRAFTPDFVYLAKEACRRGHDDDADYFVGQARAYLHAHYAILHYGEAHRHGIHVEVEEHLEVLWKEQGEAKENAKKAMQALAKGLAERTTNEKEE